MAIIEELGVGVNICIGGQPVAEYDDTLAITNDEDDYVASNTYVESVDGAEYTIMYTCLPDQRWLYNNPKNRLTFRVYIDGKERCAHSVNRNLILYSDGKLNIEGAETFRGHGQPTVLSKFKFHAVTTIDEADDQAIEADKKRAETLGLIKVEVWREYQSGNVSAPDGHADEELDTDDNEMLVAEKALKGRAISHGTAFSPAIETQATFLFDMAEVDESPVAVFNINYRSKEALRQELVVPRTPRPSSPVDLESPPVGSNHHHGIEHLSREEILRLAKERLTEIKMENEIRPKVEADQADAQANSLLMNISRPLAGGREVIDLTDD